MVVNPSFRQRRLRLLNSDDIRFKNKDQVSIFFVANFGLNLDQKYFISIFLWFILFYAQDLNSLSFMQFRLYGVATKFIHIQNMRDRTKKLIHLVFYNAWVGN